MATRNGTGSHGWVGPVPDHIARVGFRDSRGRPRGTRDLRSVPELPNVGGPGTVRFSYLSTVLGHRTANSSHNFRYITCVLVPIARQVPVFTRSTY
jgi:hypothetical protein